jgi:hypothetical protein
MTDEKNAVPPLLFTQRGLVATVSINHPPMNPMSLEFFDELEQLVPKLAADRSGPMISSPVSKPASVDDCAPRRAAGPGKKGKTRMSPDLLTSRITM